MYAIRSYYVCLEYANDIANPLFSYLDNDTASIERRNNFV